MDLKVKLLNWSAGLPVAMLNEETAKKMGAHLKERVSIKTSSKEMSMIIDTAGSLIKKNEIAVSSEIKQILGLKEHQAVEVNLVQSTKSLEYIKKKLNKFRLSEREIKVIVKDIVANALSESEIALFVSAMYKYGMNMKETIFMIKAMYETGNRLILKSDFVADKHSIGGIAGNRTTPIVVSICASAGLVMPKTSSRAITSAAGTADVIETIAKVDFSIKELKEIIKKTNACMIWGGSIGFAPADSQIIQIEKVLNIDPESQLLASIMAKKLAVGSKYILIDIPYGKSAKVSKKKAVALKKKFEFLGGYFHKKLKCVLTDGSQPIGNGIGPVLELMDIIAILNQKEKGPEDLEKKSLFLSGQLLEMTGKAKKGQGEKMAQKILYSGKAFEKFKQIIKAQHGSLKKIKLSRIKKEILSTHNGRILEIDNKKINSLARAAGCPADKSSGVYLHLHVGGKVRKGDALLTIYSESKNRLNDAVRFYKDNKIIKIG
ncbi:MAG: thymidine phosphorylase [Nanoarchaeota archaeon]|nr:thymidine phosphorylase [Nanoarchaeota archaeon]